MVCSQHFLWLTICLVIVYFYLFSVTLVLDCKSHLSGLVFCILLMLDSIILVDLDLKAAMLSGQLQKQLGSN